MEEEYINVNLNSLFSKNQTLLTQRGWINPDDLQDGDKVVAVNGESTWIKIDIRKKNKTIRNEHFFG